MTLVVGEVRGQHGVLLADAKVPFGFRDVVDHLFDELAAFDGWKATLAVMLLDYGTSLGRRNEIRNG